MKSKLFVIEGVDNIGKATQSKLLTQALESLGLPVKLISYPDYNSKSSSLVQMYLDGEIKDDPSEVNPYAASLFYTSDRYISFMKEVKEYWDRGYIIIADRYTTSNMVYQGSKISGGFHKTTKYIDWLEDLEYDKIGLPRPDKVIYLNVGNTTYENLIAEKQNRDIHEKDMKYIIQAKEVGQHIAEHKGWEIISCDLIACFSLRDKQSIHQDILCKILGNS